MCEDEETARPWVNLLARAGVELEHAERAGVYTFNFAGAEELITTRTRAETQPFYWLDQVEEAAEEA